MHDLYHELAEYVSAKELSRMEEATLQNIDEDAMHVSLAPSEGSNEIVQFYALHNQYQEESHIPSLRSLLVVQKDEPKDEGNILRINFRSGLMKLFRSLRALDLSNTDIGVLPNSIGELIHLRYLSLENTRIKCLPESISALFKLHTMNLKFCNYLSELPQGIKFLSNLRHLELPLMDNWNVYMPHEIGELTKLQTMHMIKVGGDSASCGIDDLVNLGKLRGELCISGIENVSIAQINVESTTKDKRELRKLILHWSCVDSMFADEALPVLDCLQPHSALEELIIWGFSGVRFPVWLGNQYMFRLANLELKDCPNCEELPFLGQLPCLKHVSVNSLTSIKYVGRMLYTCEGTNLRGHGSSTSKTFPLLETLKFTGMDSWEKWDEIEPADFPRLKHLTIIKCNKLRQLPKLQALQKLRIKGREHLLDLPSFPSLQYIKIEGFCSVRDILQLPLFSHVKMIELQCSERLMSEEKRLKHFAPFYSLLLKKEQIHKILVCQALPFQNHSVQDNQVHFDH
jgi:hypothetical protein